MTSLAIVVPLVVCCLGLAASLILQVWVQPRQFRQDSRDQSKLIADRFDAKLELVKTLADRAQMTLDAAAKFFESSEDRLSRLERQMEQMQELTHVVHQLTELTTALDKRVFGITLVCQRQHGDSLRIVAENLEEQKP